MDRQAAQDVMVPMAHAVVGDGDKVLAVANTPSDVALMQAQLGGHGRLVELVDRNQILELQAATDSQSRLLARVAARLTLAGVPGEELIDRVDRVLTEVASLRARLEALPKAAIETSAAEGAPDAKNDRYDVPPRSALHAAVRELLGLLLPSTLRQGVPILRIHGSRQRLEAALAQEPHHPLHAHLRTALDFLEPKEGGLMIGEVETQHARDLLQQASQLLQFSR